MACLPNCNECNGKSNGFGKESREIKMGFLISFQVFISPIESGAENNPIRFLISTKLKIYVLSI